MERKKVLPPGAVAMVSLAIIASLAAAEIGARLLYKESYLTGLLAASAVYHHIPIPRYRGRMTSAGDFDVAFTANNKGMRGPGDYEYKKGKDFYRIGLLGDSFPFGVGVKGEETAPYLLGEMLNGSGKGRYEVYNFGVNSYSPLLEYIYLKQEVVK